MARKAAKQHEQKPIAYLSFARKVLYVVAAKRAKVARLLGARRAAAENWQVRGAGGSAGARVFVATVPSDDDIITISRAKGDRRIFERAKCIGQRPPGWDDTGCIRQPGGVNFWYERKQTVGYSFCRRTRRTRDTCEEAYVQVGEWIYYRDHCQTVTRRIPYFQWVCIP